MEKYDKYKDSGVEWIGEVPDGWKIIRGKYTTKIYSGFPFDSTKFTVNEEDMPLIRIRDIMSPITETYYCGEYPIESIVKHNDVLIGMDGDFNISKWPGQIGILNQRVCKLISTRKLLSAYAYYMLLTPLKCINDVTYATTVKHLSSYDILNSYLPTPPLDEQDVIASYLDSKCSKIDHVIATQQKRVELLKELKQSIITRAVTRGINPNAKMKDSGVEWIGEIPEHWEIMRLNELGRYKKGPFGSALKVTMFVRKGTDTIKVYQQQNAINKNWELGDDYIKGDYYREAMQGFTVEPDDIIVSCAGTIGECYIIPKEAEPGIINQALMKMNMDERKVILEYFLLLFDILLKEESAKSSNGSAMKNIPPFDVMKKMIIPLPSKEEQAEILSYLEKQYNLLDSSITKALRQIELLKEYKQSLITEVVTGKRKVC